MSERVEGFPAFCIERHPLDKCLSHYAMIVGRPHHGKGQRQVLKSMSWSEYVRHGNFPVDLSLYPTQAPNDPWQPDVAAVIDYRHLEHGVATFLESCGLSGFSIQSRAKSGFRSHAGVPSPDQVSSEERGIVMRAFGDTITFLADHFGIIYQ
jgi:hypothetical protein